MFGPTQKHFYLFLHFIIKFNCQESEKKSVLMNKIMLVQWKIFMLLSKNNILFVLVTFNCIITDAFLHYVESEFKKNLENVPCIKIKKSITVCFFLHCPAFSLITNA